MRSFFKRPSWATRGEEDLPADFYRRADQTYGDIIAARKESRERSTKSPNDPPTDDRERRKRRRPSHEDDSAVEDDGAASKSPERRRTKTDQQQQHSPEVGIQMNPCADDGPVLAIPEASPSPDNASDVIISDTANATRGPSSSSVDGTHDGIDSTPVDHSGLLSRQESARKSESTPQDSTPSKQTHEDMIIEILITSKIKDTKPLIVQRKMSQSLKEVRLVWCSRQNLSKEAQATVYLTWKGKRLFDVTTCKSLGIGAGSLTAEDYLQYDEGNVRIHMEAVTDDTSLLPMDERQPSEDNSDPAQESSQLEDAGQLESQSIVLKCPGYADLGIGTAPDMKVSQVITIFREARNIPEGQNVYLTFDGDRLEPEKCLEDYDIADDDLLDVIVR